MRNRYSGICYYCNKMVLPKQGHFERNNDSWRVIHADCVFEQRKEKRTKLKALYEQLSKNQKSIFIDRFASMKHISNSCVYPAIQYCLELLEDNS